MGLAFEAIYPKVYPVAYELFEKGLERHFVAGKIFKQFGKEWGGLEFGINIEMIDLSISCAENDFKDNLQKGTSGRIAEDKVLSRLIGVTLEKNKIEGLEKINTEQKNGNEIFTFNGNNTKYKLIDFWKWNVSDLLSNATRGTLAEFIVAMAMEIDLSDVREEWDAYDLETNNGIKIEVKASAYLQTWFQKGYSKIIFSIKPAYSWNSETNELSKIKSRPSDVYVFCLLNHKDKNTVNPLILEQWIFYVVSTNKINNICGNKNSIQLRALEKITECVYFDKLNEKIKEEYSKNK